MTIKFYNTTELNSSNDGKIPIRSPAILNIENDDKYCFLWSILAHLHPCEKINHNRVTNYKQNFNELNNDGFDFSKKLICTDTHIIEKLSNLSENSFI